MKVFVVSLSRSSERRARMQCQLNQQGINFEFFDAVDASQVDFKNSDKAVPEITIKRKGYELRAGELGCFSSHYMLWQECIKLREPILILEDNVDIQPNVKEVIEAIHPLVDRYGYIKLSATQPSKFTPIETIDSRHELGQYAKKSCGTTAYALSPGAAKAFIENASTFIEPVDDYMEKPWRHGVKTYSVSPSLFERANINSTISSDTTKRKEKQKLSLLHKVYIEIYRSYESVMKKIYWTHNHE
ncbi:glycosyltransferase family 25 protein [Vibrio ponticus]|uniref:Glycosyltransferase family 25 protein n=1 Tax=Vibrio ponticus TaxID=265668 RepID=A0A3N3DUH1_9VIBR|nr:glycosyltransferase family 25 protein [Vibrio ponticus]ROV58137.1 glycosyltransferase family 25 protein [Vibrio ponticus]